MVIIVIALSGCRSDRLIGHAIVQNAADAARRSKVTAVLETKDQRSLRRQAYVVT